MISILEFSIPITRLIFHLFHIKHCVWRTDQSVKIQRKTG